MVFFLQSIKIGYLNVKVEVYIPNPLRCFNCQKYGHGKKFCKSAAVCARCGESHPNDANVQCTNPPKCANCSGNHPAYSKDCPRWTIEKQVQQVKATNNISFVEARRKVETEAASHRPTIAAIISRPPGNQDARPVSSCTPLKHHVQTQTILTWPSSSGSPVETSDAVTQTRAEGPVRPDRTDRKCTLSADTSVTPPHTVDRRSNKSPCQNKNINKLKAPKLNRPCPHMHRPPKSDTDTAIRTKNRYDALEMERDYPSSDSESQNPS